MKNVLNDHVVVDGHRIATGRHGQGTPVVLIHGTPAHAVIWRAVTPRLVEAGCQVHLFDLLGYGKSERPTAYGTSVAAQGRVLEALLDRWDLKTVHLVAHDIGGAVALRYAVTRPERLLSLTLIDTVSYDSWPSETWRKIISDHLEKFAAVPAGEMRELLTRQLKMAVHDESRMSGEVLEAYLEPITGAIGQPSFFLHQVSHYDSRYTEEISGRLGAINVPVQIIWGMEDRWQPVSWAHRLAKDIPGARLHLVPDAGHFLMEDAPETVADLVNHFVREPRR
ncbi:alpha/beta fold hydrolase [Dongia deserti]|uniref:alpha/beta fold hydrolase n=1 Tax=Dongia deserti TaxID=2268030 RepID=UPI000E65378F|nr:alpha/beta fold hydrolase [Dongia deserti]